MTVKKEGTSGSHKLLKAELTYGQKASDKLTSFCGSWQFIFGVLGLILVWMLLNVYLVKIHSWDPYPFILLNFVLSCLAALQAPIILMSQNREAERDRINAKYDYTINRRAEREITMIQKDLVFIKRKLQKKRDS